MPPATFAASNLAWLATATAFKFRAGGFDFLQERAQPPDVEHPPWVDDCRSVYIDVGSGTGAQLRKMYEPGQYCGAADLETFSRLFGPPDDRRARASETGICAFGFEPNPVHRHRLGNLERYYNALGWHVHFYPYAAWKEDYFLVPNKTTELHSGPLGADHAGDDSTADARKNTLVHAIDLAAFVMSLPPGSVKLMTMDIGGAEHETISHMLQRRVLCSGVIDVVLLESRTGGSNANWEGERTVDSVRETIAAVDCGNGSSPTTAVFQDYKSRNVGYARLRCPSAAESTSIAKVIARHKITCSMLFIIATVLFIFAISFRRPRREPRVIATAGTRPKFEPGANHS